MPSPVTVFGGTGFLGRRIVRHLRDADFAARVVSRHPDVVPSLFSREVSGIESVHADVTDDGSVARAVAGAWAVVNTVSLYLWQAIGYAAEALPSPPLTRNQVELMKQDNISEPDAPGFETLQITPQSIEIMLSGDVTDNEQKTEA